MSARNPNPTAAESAPVVRRNRTARSTPLVAAICLLLGVSTLLAQEEARQIRRIERPADKGAAFKGPHVPLPSAESCAAAVRKVAAAYGPGTLEPWLADDFPYREEVLDLLEKVALYATDIRLEVESVESTKIDRWQLADGESLASGGAQTITSDCTADVRTRLTFDDPSTGIRTVRDIGRAQWRLRYTREAPAPGTAPGP